MQQNYAPLRRYRRYTGSIRIMLSLGGVLQSSKGSRTWSYITGLFVVLSCSTQSIWTLNFCRYHLDNVTVVSRAIGLVTSLLGPILMISCFLVKREKLIQLHETLDDLFEEELARNQETRAIALSFLHAFNRPLYILIPLITTTTLMYVSPPILNIIHQIIHHTEPRKYKLVLPAVFPWTVPDNGFVYYLHLLYGIFNSWYMLIVIIGVDTLFGLYTFQISSILRTASFRLMNPGPKDEFPELLRTCIKKHQRLLQCRNNLEDIYGIIIIRMVLANAIVMCALIYEAFPFTGMTIGKACLSVSYMTYKMLQTFVYAWYGSVVTSASEAFREAVYFSKWLDYTFDCKLRTNIILMMMQKPMIITALKICPVSVNMFTSIMNTTISYVFLLQTLDEA